jgi:hypothetical protein
MTLYILVRTLSDGLVGLSSYDYGRQLWSRCKTRKQHKCRVCGGLFPVGSTMYRPLTNKGNRMERICENCIRHMT